MTRARDLLRQIDRDMAETYLGPLDEWARLPLRAVADRLRERGWEVFDSDTPRETLRQMQDGTLPRREDADEP